MTRRDWVTVVSAWVAVGIGVAGLITGFPVAGKELSLAISLALITTGFGVLGVRVRLNGGK